MEMQMVSAWSEAKFILTLIRKMIDNQLIITRVGPLRLHRLEAGPNKLEIYS